MYQRRPVLASTTVDSVYGENNQVWLIDGMAVPKRFGKGSALVAVGGSDRENARTDIAASVRYVTDPAAPAFLSTIAETGESSRRESSRGTRETHKLQWECASGIGYFNGTPEGWRVTRVLQAFDLGNPAEPRHIRDFGLVGWEPTAQGPMPRNSISGLHQAFAHGNRLYLGYGSGNDGTLSRWGWRCS